jgi:UMP-CMP kinase
MHETTTPTANTFFIEVSGAGLVEVDGLFVPSTAPPAKSESGTDSSLGYWNGKMAWDRADGKSARNPALSYSNSYTSWRICRLDGHLSYDITSEDAMPPTDQQWHVYKNGIAPAPKIVIHHYDPREACPKPNVVFVLGGPGAGKGTMCELAQSQLDWTHLSTGDLLRAEQQAGGETAAAIEEFIATGKLVPNEIVVTLLKDAMERITRTSGKNNFLLDGFPRSLNNMDGWYEIFGREAELPKMRFDTFKAETLPTVEFFKTRGKCVELDTSQDRQSVYDLVVGNLAEFTDKVDAAKPLTERTEILLGLRPWPKNDE